MEALQYLGPMEWTAIKAAVLVIVVAILLRWSGVVRYIPNDRLGVLEKTMEFPRLRQQWLHRAQP